jgi:hypothetical protein
LTRLWEAAVARGLFRIGQTLAVTTDVVSALPDKEMSPLHAEKDWQCAAGRLPVLWLSIDPSFMVWCAVAFVSCNSQVTARGDKVNWDRR